MKPLVAVQRPRRAKEDDGAAQMVNAFAAALRRRLSTAAFKVSRTAMARAAALALLVLLGVTYSTLQTYRWWQDQRSLVSTDDAYVAADIVAVTPKVSGTITQVPVSDDEVVRAGELLAKLDDRDLAVKHRRAVAGVDAANAQISSARARLHLQSAMQAQAQAELASVEADVGRRPTARKATALLQRAQASLDATNLQVVVLDAQEKEAQAALARAKAEVSAFDLALSYCEIRSPVDGIVGSRVARVGAQAAIGSALFSIVPATDRWVEANFKETQIAAIKPGLPVRIEVDGLPGTTLKGVVRGIAPASGSEFAIVPTENATGNFTKVVQRVPVRIDLDDGANHAVALRPGMSAIVHIDTRDTPARPREPIAAPPRSQGAS